MPSRRNIAPSRGPTFTEEEVRRQVSRLPKQKEPNWFYYDPKRPNYTAAAQKRLMKRVR